MCVVVVVEKFMELRVRTFGLKFSDGTFILPDTEKYTLPFIVSVILSTEW